MNNEELNTVEKTEETKKKETKSYPFVYGISFKKALQTYFFGSEDKTLKVHDMVVVETIRGLELGEIKIGAKPARKVKLETALKPILRVATQEDLDTAVHEQYTNFYNGVLMLNIALDGPAGSGKSTIAKHLSKSLNILYLDTGAMYRACALKAKKLGVSCKDEEAVNAFIDTVDIKVKYVDGAQKTYLDGEDVSTKIRENDISMMASDISALKKVRIKLVELQREIANSTDCILDGRDIGTYVLPDAKYKFYNHNFYRSSL